MNNASRSRTQELLQKGRDRVTVFKMAETYAAMRLKRQESLIKRLISGESIGDGSPWKRGIREEFSHESGRTPSQSIHLISVPAVVAEELTGSGTETS